MKLKSEPNEINSGHVKPTRVEGFRLERMENELLLFNPAETKVYYLNQPASLVWTLCDGERSVEEIVDLLASVYPEASVDNIKKEIDEAIHQFGSFGCIEYS